MSISALILDFLNSLEHNNSPLTIKNYAHYLNVFLEFAGDIHPSDINLRLINKYQMFLSRTDPETKKPLKDKTQNYFLIALRSFLRYLSKRGINTLEVGKIKLKRWERYNENILDESYLKQLLKAPDVGKIQGLRDRAILETLFATGLLVSKLILLNRDFLKGESLSVSACFWLEKYLALRKDTFKPLFIRFQGKVDLANNGEKMRLTSRSIERIVEKYAKKLNLPVKATPQTFRHSFN